MTGHQPVHQVVCRIVGGRTNGAAVAVVPWVGGGRAAADRRAARRRTAPVAAAAAAVAVLLPSGCSEPGPDTTTPASAHDVAWPAAGALFSGSPDDLGGHHCSAAVVDTSAGDVVMTAAHCVAAGDGSPAWTGESFVPGYHDHLAPFGTWTVTAAAVDQEWLDDADPDHDIAFLTVDRVDAPPIEDVTGAFHLDLDPGADIAVDAVGYPDFADAPQVRSGTAVRWSVTQLQLDADGLYDGTSGGPWLVAPNDTDLIGVTGGHKQGGLDPATSYATYPADAAADLFREVGGAP